MAYPRFHVYTFARATVVGLDDEEDVAINIVANELLPPTTTTTSDIHGTVNYRRSELDEEFRTDFTTRSVRDVAPGKVVVCVSFSLTPKLVRYMQGEYL